MRKLRILLAEVIGLGVLIGWLMWKYPELVDDIIPWVALLVLWHFTWEFVLDRKIVRHAASATGRKLPRLLAWVLVFVIGECISILYWKGINKSLVRLAAIAAQRAAQGVSQSAKNIAPDTSGSGQSATPPSVPLPKQQSDNSAAKPSPSTLYAEPPPAKSNHDLADKPPTLIDLFGKDFPNLMRVSDNGFDLSSSDGEIIHIGVRIYLDFPAKSEFIGFYIPSSGKEFEACLALVDRVEPIITDLPKRHEVIGGDARGVTSIRELTFSGRVFLYHEWPLSNKQKADLVEAYSAKGLDVQFRGLDYLTDQVRAWHQEHDARKSH